MKREAIRTILSISLLNFCEPELELMLLLSLETTLNSMTTSLAEISKAELEELGTESVLPRFKDVCMEEDKSRNGVSGN